MKLFDAHPLSGSQPIAPGPVDAYCLVIQARAALIVPGRQLFEVPVCRASPLPTGLFGLYRPLCPIAAASVGMYSP